MLAQARLFAIRAGGLFPEKRHTAIEGRNQAQVTAELLDVIRTNMPPALNAAMLYKKVAARIVGGERREDQHVDTENLTMIKPD